MNEYDQTFNPNVLTGHYDLISWFSNFVISRHSIGLFIYFFFNSVLRPNWFMNKLLSHCLRMTRPLTLK